MSGEVSGVGLRPVEASCPRGAAGPSPSLVPEPETPFSESVASDAMSALYQALSLTRDNSLQAGQQQVSEDENLQKAAIKKQLQAIQQAEADRPHGFWHDLENVAMIVAKVAAVVGSAAVTVATAGAGAPVLVCVALALSIGGGIVAQTHVFGDKTALVGLGMSLAGAALGFGGSLVVTGTTGTLHILQVAGGCVEAAGGAASVVGGSAHIVNGVSLEHVEEDQADAVQAKGEATRAGQSAEWTIDDIRSEDKSYEEEKQSLAAVIQTRDEIPLGITKAIKG